MSAARKLLSTGQWHFQHGPIDLIIGAEGQPDVLEAAHDAAWLRFATVLDELVHELGALRKPVTGDDCPVQGRIARRMWEACNPFRNAYITPMAAVAGAVAQELITCYDSPGVVRAWINNGGDIALHLSPGASVRIGLFADLGTFDFNDASCPLRTDGDFAVDATLPVRGVATSGWRGRSFSLGIADSVTVLARTAAKADAAASMIANAVNVNDMRIVRKPANTLKDDSDLGELLVTQHVPALGNALVQQALRAGQRRARELKEAGLIWSAVLVCQGWVATDDTPPQRLQQDQPAKSICAPNHATSRASPSLLAARI